MSDTKRESGHGRPNLHNRLVRITGRHSASASRAAEKLHRRAAIRLRRLIVADTKAEARRGNSYHVVSYEVYIASWTLRTGFRSVPFGSAAIQRAALDLGLRASVLHDQFGEYVRISWGDEPPRPHSGIIPNEEE